MKPNFKQLIKSHLLLTMAVFLPFTACDEPSEVLTGDHENSLIYDRYSEAHTVPPPHSDSVVVVIATHNHTENLHRFQVSADEISSGWTTFRFKNASESDHFFLIYKAPDEAIAAANEAGKPLLDHWFNSVTVPFQEEFNPFVRGEIGYGEFVDNLVASILEKGPWFFDPGAATMGGPGFTSAGTTSETTVHLTAGQYIVECYVKDENEVFHSYIGMLEQITVTEDESVRPEPNGSIKLNISSTNGIELNRPMSAGKQTVEIYFEDQAAYEHLLGHNVQLVRLADKDDEDLLNRLTSWMDWRTPGGLVYRAPEGAEFLGGTMEMTAGSRAYFHTNLEPGDYAWIAEVPEPGDKNMLKTFNIPGRPAGTR